MAEDIHFANVVYLNHFNGLQGAVVSPDVSNSAHTVTFEGLAEITTSNPLFGSACLDLLASGDDNVNSGPDADFSFGSGEFTLEFAVKYAGFIGINTLYSYTGGAGDSEIWIYQDGGSIFMTLSADGTIVDTFSGAVAEVAGVWQRIAVDRDSAGDVRLYVDGVMLFKVNYPSINAQSSIRPMYFGYIVPSNPSNLDGLIDAARITKGVGRYVSDGGYTLATEEFPDSGPLPPVVDSSTRDFDATQEGDVLLYQTVDAGEINIAGGIAQMVPGFETALYLSLMGGNLDDDGREGNELTWFGNLSEADAAFKQVSETQFLLRSIASTSGNLRRIEDAARRDLQWMLDKNIASSVEVLATMPGLNKVKLSITILAIGEEQRFEFTENWESYLN